MTPAGAVEFAHHVSDQFVVLALQALSAAIFEEKFALRGGDNGFRNRRGEFVSKRHAIVRAFLGVGGIAFAVTVVPPLVDALLVAPVVQGAGVGVLLSVVLIHVIADRWTIREVEYAPVAIGLLLLSLPYVLLVA